MKIFSKICRSESTLNCRFHHLWIKLTRTQHKWCEKPGQNPDRKVVMYLCMYVYFKISKNLLIYLLNFLTTTKLKLRRRMHTTAIHTCIAL